MILGVAVGLALGVGEGVLAVGFGAGVFVGLTLGVAEGVEACKVGSGVGV